MLRSASRRGELLTCGYEYLDLAKLPKDWAQIVADAERAVTAGLDKAGSKAALEAHKARKDPGRIAVVKPLMDHIDFKATDVVESGMREFGTAAHLESQGLKKTKGKGVRAIIGFGEEE